MERYTIGARLDGWLARYIDGVSEATDGRKEVENNKFEWLAQGGEKFLLLVVVQVLFVSRYPSSAVRKFALSSRCSCKWMCIDGANMIYTL